MKNGVKFVEALGVLLALASGMAFSLKHNFWGIWLGVGAGCLILIGIGIWLTFDEEKNSTKEAPSQNEAPSTTLEVPVSNRTDQGNLVAPGATGNFNTGNVNGNLTQTFNAAPADREITPAQREIIKKDLADVPNKKNVSVISPSMGGETADYAGQIFQTLTAANFQDSSIIQLMPSQSGWIGLKILVKNPNNPPAIAIAIANAFAHAGIKFEGGYNPEVSDDSRVIIKVGKAEKP